jgi:hypothetical protein
LIRIKLDSRCELVPEVERTVMTLPVVRRLVAITALWLLLILVPAGRAQSAPPWWLEGLGQYRIVDASGRIAYRPSTDASLRVAYRPAYPPSPLLRGRPLYLSGYAGATYGPGRPVGAYVLPIGGRIGSGQPGGGLFGHLRHGQ